MQKWIVLVVLALSLGTPLATAQTPAQPSLPDLKEHFGFVPGDDYKLANYSQIRQYYQKLAAASNRVRLVDFGPTSEGRTMFYAVISSPENLARLDAIKAANRRLALGLAAPEEAAELARSGKAVVWIDSSMHATEVAPAQHSPHLAYRLASGQSDEIRRMLDKVVLIQLPVTNPDGLDMVAEWYAKNVGTPYENAPLPGLYQKYAGHDNNRDWFMMNLKETQNISRLLYEEWFPQVVYNQHQAPPFPSRIFLPPYSEPLNPNIPPTVMEGINLIGTAMKERLHVEDKTGAMSYFGFDGWWNGGLRSTPAFHNMHGILTEVAFYGWATPFEYQPKHLPERFQSGIPTKQPSIFYERPWLGGRWTLRDAIEYLITTDLALLDLMSTRTEAFLKKSYDLARAGITAGNAGSPYAFLLPPDQWDTSSAVEMVSRLIKGGVQVSRATKDFLVGTKTYAAGTYVIPAGQPFRSYVLDLLQPHQYPELRQGSATGPLKRPYDIAGWTLSYLMGVQVDRVEDRFQADLEPVAAVSPAATLNPKQNAAFRTVADLLAKGEPVRRLASGEFVTRQDASRFDAAAWELRQPRIAVYQGFTANMDAGWTQWLLDYYNVPVTMLGNAELRQGDLRKRFDTVVLAQQSATSILWGIRDGEQRKVPNGDGWIRQRPEFTGGIELPGLVALDRFVRDGGTLLAFDAAADLPAQYFPLPVRQLLRSSAAEPAPTADPAAFYCPGSLLRITVDPTHPFALGMPAEAFAFSSGGQAFESALLPEANQGDRAVRSIAKYATKDLLASGFIQNERIVLGKDSLVEARHGQGRVVLFGFRPQFRGQSFGTFKFVLNAIYQSSAKDLRSKP